MKTGTLIFLIVLGGASVSVADDLLGITLLQSCPYTEAYLDEVRSRGAELGADYTQIVRVAGESECPQNQYGAVKPYVQTFTDIVHLPDPARVDTTAVGFGVTVGLHYRTSK